MDFNDFIEERKGGGAGCTALVPYVNPSAGQLTLPEFARMIGHQERVICLMDPTTGDVQQRRMSGHDRHIGAVGE